MRKHGICRKKNIAAALALGTLLSGCVAYPAGGYYAAPYSAPYYAEPYYAAPSFAFVAPPVVGYWGGGRGWRGQGGNGYGGYGRRWR